MRAILLIGLLAYGCSSDPDPDFAALQQRGEQAMGVNQYTSTHTFDDLEDGGRIELQRDDRDIRDIETIRSHLKTVVVAFAQGNFDVPGFVHAREVPGTRVMAQKKAVIRYRFSELPKGGEIRITTSDAEALRAIHEFLAFQRKDHRAAGHVHSN
ncbi:MAG TPA: hypothetical protein VGD49_02440 [Longimicrobiales bacterium]